MRWASLTPGKSRPTHRDHHPSPVYISSVWLSAVQLNRTQRPSSGRCLIAHTQGRHVNRPLKYRVIRGCKRRPRWGGDADRQSQPLFLESGESEGGLGAVCQCGHSSWELMCKGKKKVPEAWGRFLWFTLSGAKCRFQFRGFWEGSTDL